MGNRAPVEAPEQIFKCTTHCILIYYAYVFIFTYTYGKSWLDTMSVIIIYVKSLLKYGYDLSAKLTKPVLTALQLACLCPSWTEVATLKKKKNAVVKGFTASEGWISSWWVVVTKAVVWLYPIWASALQKLQCTHSFPLVMDQFRALQYPKIFVDA